MATSHVFVVDGRVRKARIPTSPSTAMTDVLKNGCQKLGVKPDQFILKYNNKPVDLSVSFRLSGLPSGANLELVQASRSPTVISIALQLPASEQHRRVVQKFSSATTLWQILRVVETAEKLNLTERASPSTSEGAGRLYYEMPVFTVMNKEMDGTFGELQKTLAQIGVTSGNVLLKLGFKSSGIPLEEAMKEISSYFKEDGTTAALQSPSNRATEAVSTSKMDIHQPSSSVASPPVPASNTDTSQSNPTPSQPPSVQDPTSQSLNNTTNTTSPTPQAPNNHFTVYKPPTTTTPLAATLPFQETDYVPTIEHAQTHQSRLQASSRNTRLLSSSELAAKESARTSSLHAVSSIKVRIRFPDLSVLETELVKGSTSGSELYNRVRGALRTNNEPFLLKYVDSSTGRTADVPDSQEIDMVKDLNWRGGSLVTFAWEEGVEDSAKRQPALREEMLSSARRMEIPIQESAVKSEKDGVDGGKGFLGGVIEDVRKAAGKMGGQEKEAKLKSLLGFGKRK